MNERVRMMNDCMRCCSKPLSRRTFLKTTGTAVILLYGSTALQGCEQETPQETEALSEGPKQLTEEEKNYYILRKEKLMKEFTRFAKFERDFLITQFDESKVDTWIAQARQEYEAFIPHLPYVGGDDNRLTKILIITSTFVPLLKILRDEGVSTRQNGQMVVESVKAYYQKMSALLKWVMRQSYFKDSTKQRKRDAASRSQLRWYPGDWVYDFVDGDGHTFDYGINYTECGIQKLWSAHGLEEFVPYVCLCDFVTWRAIGVEATRTQTLANGAPLCDFRFIRKGSQGPVGWPPESNPEWTSKYET